MRTVRTVVLHRSEVKSQVDGMSARVDRVERELEYLENKIPSQSDIEMDEALLEQQIKAAELDQLKNKVKIKVGKGKKGFFIERKKGKRESMMSDSNNIAFELY